MPFCYAFTFFQFPHILGAAGVFPVFFFPRFWLLASFFPWMGGRFCNARSWVVFLTLWELPMHFFHSHFCDFMCFYHGCEEPFTFLAVSLTFGSHAQTIWGVFPCYELCSLINFRTVCFSPCCEPFLLLRMGLCNSFFPV